MRTPIVRLGFVGVGNMGQAAHLRNFQMVPQCEVVAIADVRSTHATAVAHKWGVPHVYTSHQQMLHAHPEIDALVAIQPFTRHGTLIPELLAYGKPILTEKPIAGSVDQGQAIVAAMHAHHTWMMIGYHKRSDPATIYAKTEIDRLIQSGELGKMTYIRILMPAGDWIANGFNQNIWSAEAEQSLAEDPPAADMDAPTNTAYWEFVNYYIHQVNLMRHLLGEDWHVTYAAKSGHLLAGESTSGVTCSIEMSPYQTTVDWQESALVCFERGWVKLELPAPLAFNRSGRVEIMRDPGNGAQPTTLSPHLPWVHAMWNQAEHFVAAVAGTRLPVCTAQEALADITLAREYIRLYLGK
jgi:predicted dehydrogenase